MYAFYKEYNSKDTGSSCYESSSGRMDFSFKILQSAVVDTQRNRCEGTWTFWR